MYPTSMPSSASVTESAEATTVSEALHQLLAEVQQVLEHLRPDAAEILIRELEQASRIYCFGAGRSGFVLRSFCMRLMQLGFHVYYIGETITPRIQPGDLLVVTSGSGETAHTCELVRQAKVKHVRTLVLTAHPGSTLGREADVALILPGTTKLTLAQETESFQCPGSLFEQATFLFLEAVVMILFSRRCSRNRDAVLARHADLE